MNSTPKTFRAVCYLMIFAGSALFMLGIRGCEPTTTEPTPQPEQQRQRITNTDSLRSVIESQYRDSLQAQIKASNERYAKLLAKLPASKRKASSSVKTYQNTPTIANCDTAIADMQHHVAEVETGLAIADSVMKAQASVIGSFGRSVARKDSVITELSAGWETANLENAKLQKKLKRRNRLIAIGAGALAIFAGGVAASR